MTEQKNKVENIAISVPSETILVDAVKEGCTLEAVKSILSEGINVDFKDKKGYSALMYAVDKKNIEIAKALIRAGADVNTKDKDGFSALTKAITNNDKKVVDALLKA
ncbi:MAG: ankyrin repeat domain-containing protein, partial [Thermodesulfobacteriota bacterium]